MITFSYAGHDHHTDRIIGRLVGDEGPSIVFVGGMHGNERSGVIALQQVFAELAEAKVGIHGEVLGLAGNLAALAENKRFLSQDLNRIWDREISRRASASEIHSMDPLAEEVHEQRELLRVMKPYLQRDRPCIFIDLHTTSCPSVPFIVMNDQLANRRFAQAFTVPTVLGIEEYLTGPMLSYLNDFGHIALAFEAGQHDDPESIHTHVAFIYMALIKAGVIDADQLPQARSHRERLARLGRDNHDFFEVTFRQNVSRHDQFAMNPGFENFAFVKKGQPLANDREGEVVARHAGRIFMPLYQSIGSDGFFIVRRVPAWALKLSTVLRKINLERMLVWLPGVIRCPDHPDALMVNRRMARFLSIELFHLLGYRRKKIDGNVTTFVRREVD